MTPVDYLARYCRVNERRKALYRKVFEKYKKKSDKDDYVDIKVKYFNLLKLIKVHFLNLKL